MGKNREELIAMAKEHGGVKEGDFIDLLVSTFSRRLCTIFILQVAWTI